MCIGISRLDVAKGMATADLSLNARSIKPNVVRKVYRLNG